MSASPLLCGVPIDDVTLAETLDLVVEMVEQSRRTGRTHQIATVNVNFLTTALRDSTVRGVLQRADLAVPDGMPVVWGAKLLGAPLRERVAGADLVPMLGRLCAEHGYSLYLFGGAPGVAAKAADLLRAAHPDLMVVGDSGPMLASPSDMDEESLDRIRRFDADVLCVALGHPKQELWIEHHRATLGIPVLVGVGGSLDFLTGTQQRAAGWMQRTGTEWLYRVAREPRRLARRYAYDFWHFVPRMVRDLVYVRTESSARSAVSEVSRVGNTITVLPHGRLDLQAAALGLNDAAWDADGPGLQVVVDLRYRTTLTYGEIRTVAGLAKRLSTSGGRLTLSGVSRRIRRKLRALDIDGMLSLQSPHQKEGPEPRAGALHDQPTRAAETAAPPCIRDRENHA